MIKDLGPGGMRLKHVPLDMRFAQAFGGRNPDAYERLRLDVVRANPTPFMRRGEVDAAWRCHDPHLPSPRAKRVQPPAHISPHCGPTPHVAPPAPCAPPHADA